MKLLFLLSVIKCNQFGVPIGHKKAVTESFGKVMPMMSKDMRFKESALRLIVDSFQELQILDFKPDPKSLYTEEFLPPVNQ